MTEMIEGDEPVSAEQQLQLRDIVKREKAALDKVRELRDYCKFAEDSGVEQVHLTPEMFALVKQNLPAR
jgi:hypothetical protein